MSIEKTLLTMMQAQERIAELEAELMEQARVNGMGGEREAKLMARVERLEQALDVAMEALEKSMYPQKAQLDAIAKIKKLK